VADSGQPDGSPIRAVIDMRNAIVMMLLAVVSSSVAAEWVRVGHTESFTAYANPATLRKTGYMARMWQLFDYASVQSATDDKQYLSTRSRFEHDCNEMRTRQLAVRAHAKNMGAGKIIDSVSTTGEWKPIPPDSILQTMWETACGNR
jgi:hypothetical protein